MQKTIEKALGKAGLDPGIRTKPMCYMHVDQRTELINLNNTYRDKLEILDIKDALKIYGWLKSYLWKAVSRDKDEFTRRAARSFSGGYFIRVFRNKKVDIPLESCMLIKKDGYTQVVHNIIIAEEGSELNIISGCLLNIGTRAATHIGISEFFVKDNSKLNFTMVHTWEKDTVVRPRSAAIIGNNGQFVSNYILLSPTKDLQMYPVAYLKGKNSRAIFNSLVYLSGKSHADMGSKVVLTGKGARSEIIARTIAKDKSKIITRGLLEGRNSECRAHLECRGIIMDDRAIIHAIPEIYSEFPGAELSHEAAVGRLADQEIMYLMTRGLSEDAATSLLIRGFLDVEILGLPQALKKRIEQLVRSTVGAS